MTTREQVVFSILSGFPLEVDETNFHKVRSFVVDFILGQLKYGSTQDAEKGRAVLFRLDDEYPHLVPEGVENLPPPPPNQEWNKRRVVYPRVNFDKKF